MKTVEETRHDRLLMLRDEYGSVAELAKRLEKSYAQVSQWVNRSVSTRNGQPRSMNSETAREIEIRTGKPRGWMDQPVFSKEEELMNALKVIQSTPVQIITPQQEDDIEASNAVHETKTAKRSKK